MNAADEDSNLFAGVDPCFESAEADSGIRQGEPPPVLTRDELRAMNAEDLVEHVCAMQAMHAQTVNDARVMAWEYREYQKNLAYFSRAVKLAHKLNSTSLEAVASVAINEIPQYFRCDFAALFVFNNDKGMFELVRSSEPFVEEESELRDANILYSLFADFKDPYLVTYNADEHFLLFENGDRVDVAMPESWLRASGTHLLVFPLVVNQAGAHVSCTVGGLVLGKAHKEFAVNDADVAVIFSDLLASSLHNAQLVRKLNELTVIDPLTQLYNRRYLMSQLNSAMIQARRHGHNLSIALLDIDHFKQVNDIYGHVCGDDVLREVAAILKREIRNGIDIPARYGGEEFMIIMPFTGLDTAVDVANRLRNSIKGHRVECEDAAISITCSFGVAEFISGEGMEKFIDRADISLYQAKHGGRNRVCATASSPRESV